MNTSQATEPLVRDLVPAECRLQILTGPSAGALRVLRRGRHVVGRSEEADLVVASPYLSRRHFAIVVDERGLTLDDLGSSNGVALNGMLVSRARLRPGAVIEAGDTRFAVLPPEAVVGDLPQLDRLVGLIGRSLPMRRLYDRVLRAASSDATVLVRGESGTGKEVVAAAIHALSPRATGPLVTCDLASVGEGTFNTDLFGHVRGSFTGAVRDSLGLIRAARGGTALLDEIGEVTGEGQAKLLRLIERREVRPVGANQSVRVDVRFVATTLRPLEDMVKRGRFRLDLLHRLSVITIVVPPLRERLEDLPLLVPSMLAELDPEREWAVSEGALALLAAYPWPGNVRELRNVLQRVMARATAPVLDVGQLVRFAGLTPEPTEDPSALSFHAARELVNLRWERAYLAQLLERAGGSVATAAEAAGLSRVHVYRLLRKHQLVERDRGLDET